MTANQLEHNLARSFKNAYSVLRKLSLKFKLSLALKTLVSVVIDKSGLLPRTALK